jgi:hypothetical protein
LVIATHGRGIWIADDITPLQQFTPTVRAQDAHLFDVRPAIAYRHDIEADQCRMAPVTPCLGQGIFTGENAPRGTAISYYLRAPASGTVRISISDISGNLVCTSIGPAAAGINRVQWTLPLPGPTGQVGGRGAVAADASCTRTIDRASGFATLAPGAYTVTLTVGGRDYVKVVQVLEDRWLGER